MENTEMSTTRFIAQRELDILEKASKGEAVILEFKEEILALCEKFGNSGQSGGSAPMVAKAICKALKHLLLQEPISPVMGVNEEWVNVSEMYDGVPMFQNIRDSSVFKEGQSQESYYLDAIIWKGEASHDFFSGRVYIDDLDFELIGSKQQIKNFPFVPKTFYVDVRRVPITKKEAEERNLHYIEDGLGECYYSVIADKNQLNQVFEYYKKKEVK